MQLSPKQKTILRIIGVILIIIGIDLYMTYSTYSDLTDAEIRAMVSDPNYSISDDNRIVTINVLVDIPDMGFLPKGVVITVFANFDDMQRLIVSDEADVGETTILRTRFRINDVVRTTLEDGYSITTYLRAEVTPVYLGIEIDQATENVDLPDVTISL